MRSLRHARWRSSSEPSGVTGSEPRHAHARPHGGRTLGMGLRVCPPLPHDRRAQKRFEDVVLSKTRVADQGSANGSGNCPQKTKVKTIFQRF